MKGATYKLIRWHSCRKPGQQILSGGRGGAPIFAYSEKMGTLQERRNKIILSTTKPRHLGGKRPASPNLR